MECRTLTILVLLIVVGHNGSEGSYNFSNIRDILNFTVIKYKLTQLYHNLEFKINSTYRFLKYNWLLDPVCINGFEKCNDTLPCCDEDFACLPTLGNSSYRCTNISWVNDTQGEDLDDHMTRLNDLTYDINYRDWANSFEFESRSAMRREEEAAREEEIWKDQHKNEIQAQQKWLPLLKKLVDMSKRKWNEIQKLKKLKEVKEILKEKMSSRKHEDSLPSNEEQAEPQIEEHEEKEHEVEEITKPIKVEKQKPTKHHQKHAVKPKKVEDPNVSRIKSYPGIDELLKDADSVVKKHRKAEEKYPSEERRSSEKERSMEIAQIENTEDKLEEELNKLKALQKQAKGETLVGGLDDTKKEDIKELIKKEVALILDQERKLSGLMKLNELKKMQEDLKAQGVMQDKGQEVQQPQT